MAQTRTKVATVNADGVEVFYRSAGPENAPVILLLHGFPSSSFMFRNLIPLLSERYHIIAPDLPGFGFTVVPESRQYKYTFANIAKTTEAFLDVLNIERYAVYIFDYGAPTGFRLALSRPNSIAAIISQNGNAYVEGLGKDFWAPFQEYWRTGANEVREKIREAALNFDITKWQYVNGSPNPSAIPPETYHLDDALMMRPGNQDIQLDIFYDYRTNVELYPQFQEFLQTSKAPVLAVWGKNDKIFVAPGAEAYKKDVKDLEVHFLNAGHFALETNEEEVSKLILGFLRKRDFI